MKKLDYDSNYKGEMTKEVVTVIQKSLWLCRSVEARIDQEHGWEYHSKVNNS